MEKENFDEQQFLFLVTGTYNQKNRTLNKMNFYSADMLVPDMRVILNINKEIIKEMILCQLFSPTRNCYHFDTIGFEILGSRAVDEAWHEYEKILGTNSSRHNVFDVERQNRICKTNKIKKILSEILNED